MRVPHLTLIGAIVAVLSIGTVVMTNPFASKAVQDPQMSLDVTPLDNSYTPDPVNEMNVGQVDGCLSETNAGWDAEHTIILHLVVQRVENMTGWQAEVTFDPASAEVLTINPLPFGGISFLNAA